MWCSIDTGGVRGSMWCSVDTGGIRCGALLTLLGLGVVLC